MAAKGDRGQMGNRVAGTQPEDVADTVLFLASDESRYITAHELAPDAGNTEF